MNDTDDDPLLSRCRDLLKVFRSEEAIELLRPLAESGDVEAQVLLGVELAGHARQVRSVLHAAYQLPEMEGMAKLKQQAAWFKSEYADAAASLLEGLEESFAVNPLRLPPSLTRCLASTNVIENPNGAVRRVSTVIEISGCSPSRSEESSKTLTPSNVLRSLCTDRRRDLQLKTGHRYQGEARC